MKLNRRVKWMNLSIYVIRHCACLSRDWWAGHYWITGQSLQQAACVFTPSLQNFLWKGDRPVRTYFLIHYKKLAYINEPKYSHTLSRVHWLAAVDDDKQGAGGCPARKMDRGLDVLKALYRYAAVLLVEVFFCFFTAAVDDGFELF